MTIFGSDVSHYDNADTVQMFNDGIVFQTHKAGGDVPDAELGTWWSKVKDYRPRVMLGAYWVLYPGSPAARADAFLARLDSQCPGWRDGPFILQADCEKWNGDPATVPSVAEVNAFCDRLVLRMPKLRPIGYLPDWVYGDISGFRYPLWSSKYVTGSGNYLALYPGDQSPKWAPYGGKIPSVLQYSSSAVIGGQTTCDANAYRGTLADLTALLAPGWIKEDAVATLDADDKKWFVDTFGKLLSTDRTVNPISQIQIPVYGVVGDQRVLPWYTHVGYGDSNRNYIVSALTKVIADATGNAIDEQQVATLVLAGLGSAAMSDAIIGALKTLPEETAHETLAEIRAALSNASQ